eukprot:g4177.t1
MDDAAELATLQKNFGVTALGSGDPIVGFNLLATMACTLAHLAPDNGTVVHPNGSPARLGTSLLILGSASSGRVVDEIVTEAITRQNNLISHLQGYFGWLDRIRNTPGASLPTPRIDVSSVELIAETQSEFGDIHEDHAGSWRKVLEGVPHQTIQQIEKQPKFLVSVGGSKSLESQLKRLRPGCPLVHLGFSHPNDPAHFSEAGSALLEGRFPLDDGDRIIKGNILITDPMHVLVTAAQNPDERTRWLGQLLWLTDGGAGPDAPFEVAKGNRVSGARVEQRFRQALGKVMTYRFNLPNLQPLVIFADTGEATVRWAAFLREMEPRLPGISGAARNFLTSLAFGLGQMDPRSHRISVAGVEALARFLVKRMASERIAILHAGELARRRGQITRIFHKLGGGPADERKICRDLKIAAADRDEALRWLEAANLALHRRKVWERREGARLSFTDCTVPILEEAKNDHIERKDGMVKIEGGLSKVGSEGSFNTPYGKKEFPEEAPMKEFEIKGFWIDETEVTNDQFAAFVEATGYVTFAEQEANISDFPPQALAGLPEPPFNQGAMVFNAPEKFEGDPNEPGAFMSWWRWDPTANWRHPMGEGSTIEGKGDHPVVAVNYDDAAAYAKWAGKRLPTEAEWELAARGGLKNKMYTWGDEMKPGDKWMANTFHGDFPENNTADDGFTYTAPVKSFPPNGFGLYDMAGNVWEICSDFYDPEFRAKCDNCDPTGPDTWGNNLPHPIDMALDKVSSQPVTHTQRALQIHHRPGTEPTQRSHPQRLRKDIETNSLRGNLRHRQAAAVHGHRIPQPKLRRKADLQVQPGLLPFLHEGSNFSQCLY